MKKYQRKIKPKEPVKIRFRNLKGGNKSIYLEYYNGDIIRNGNHVGGKHTYEFLKLYLIPEQTKEDQEKNARTLALAKAIQSQRIVEMQNGTFGFHSRERCKDDILKYMDDLCKNEWDVQSDNYTRSIQNVKNKLMDFRGSPILFSDINRQFLTDFVTFLKTCHNDPKKGNDIVRKSLSPNSIGCYYAILRNVLNRAHKEGIINQNPTLGFDLRKIVRMIQPERPHLNMNEIQRLINTECEDTMLKHAFLFSCMCGLRISDIRKLRWKELDLGPGLSQLHIRMQKTQEILTLPLSDEAIRWLPRGQDRRSEQLVFPLRSDTSINHHLLKWAINAGVNKHITFHVARHTHATMMLTLGADIYTVSKLLGHKSITTTQIYAKIVDKKKEEAINLIPKFM